MIEATLARMSDAPMLVADESQTQFVMGLRDMAEKYTSLTDEQRNQMSAAAAEGYDEDFWDDDDPFLSMLRPYRVSDGILTIPVKGSLINNFPFTFFGMVTGYEYVQKAVERGMVDPEVEGIMFHVASPGGMVSGNFDLVDYIASRRGEKPMVAAAADHAYSAAYNIAAAADTIYVDRVGGVGSVGVVTMHIDMSEMLKKIGLDVKFVHAGKHKVDGNPYQPLPDDVKKRMQSRIDGLYAIFVSTVASNRNMQEQAVRDTEALTYMGEEGVEIGFADAVMSFSDAMDAFSGNLAQYTQGAAQMSTGKEKPNAGPSESLTQTDLENARTEGREAGEADGRAEGLTEGAKQERERIKAIMATDEAKNRRATAFNLALQTDLSVEAAQAFLKDQPEEANGKKPAGADFDTAMGADNPNITGNPGGEGADDADEDEAATASILQAFGKATGKTPGAQQH